jgi:hypothetical protein
MQIRNLLGQSATSEAVEALFQSLNTLKRPALPEDDRFTFYDWVLVRRKGMELGFVDSEYQRGGHRGAWGRGELLLVQVYFYAGFDDVAQYTGPLPFDIQWADNRQQVTAKLAAYQATHHGYITDTWDVSGYRITVSYADSDKRAERMMCQQLPVPLSAPDDVRWPDLPAVTLLWGEAVDTTRFRALWGHYLNDAVLEDAAEDGEIDLSASFGATLALANEQNTPLLRAITLHRNRDANSVGWAGSLPNELDFEDSPSSLFAKIRQQPAQQADSTTTGHAVWHFDAYTLHVLYSHIDNRLLRIKLIAPGVWKCIEDA